MLVAISLAGCPGPLIQVQDLCDGTPCDARPVDAAALDGAATDAPRPDAAAADRGAGDAATPDGDTVDRPRPDAAPPDALRPDAPLPDAVRPDLPAPDTVTVDVAQPDGSRPDAARPDTAPPDIAPLDTGPLDAAQPDAARPDTAQPDTARQDSAPVDAARLDTAGAGSLVAAVAVHTITVGEGAVAAGTQYEYGPFLAPLPDGRAKLAWCDPSAQQITLRHLDASLAAAERADTVVDGYKLFGLAAHADGRSALLAVLPAPGSCTPCTVNSDCVSCDELHLVQVGSDGVLLRDQLIDDRLAHSGMYSGGALAIGTYSGDETYAVARTVRGAGTDASASAVCRSQASWCGHQWHETWLYRVSDLSVVTSGCNTVPCGHSLFRRSVTWHPDSGHFGSVCMSDYLGSRTGFNYAVDSGGHSNLYNVWQDWPDFTNGGHPSELVVATASSFLVALSAPQSCASDCADEDHDVAVFEVSHQTRSVVGGPYWISAESTAESYPHLARYGDNFLVGWVAGGEHWLAELDGGGNIITGPEALGGVASFDYGATWQTMGAAGDVVWPRRSGSGTIDIVRIAR